MPAYEFAIELTAGDNTAFTVLTALRSMGYDALERVERDDLLRLSIADGGLPLEECAAALMRAEVVFNPNKHRLAYAADERTALHEAVVADKDDDTAALADLLRDRFGVRGLDAVERATGWRLYEASGAAPVERLEWACRELLANPFSQTFAIRARPLFISASKL